MRMNPVECAFTTQVPAYTVQLINPWLLACRPMMSLMAKIHPNEDKPETKEEQKGWLIMAVVMGI